MLAAGMTEPPKDRNTGRTKRMEIGGLYHSVVATFDLEDDGITWGKIKDHYKSPDVVAKL